MEKRGDPRTKIPISFPWSSDESGSGSMWWGGRWWKSYGSYTKVCPDRTIVCRDSDTCCPLAGETGNYGCCPWPKAVCCLDGIHCCPHNTACDVPSGRCIGEVDSATFFVLLSTVKSDSMKPQKVKAGKPQE